MKDLKFKNVTVSLIGANGMSYEYHKNNEYVNNTVEDAVKIINVHIGGDVRGNYSIPYICEEVDALLGQSTFLTIELTDGQTFEFNCDNGEGYFDFNTFDAYYIDFDKDITTEQLEELKEKNEI